MRHIKAITYNQLILFWLLRVTSLLCIDQLIQIIIILYMCLWHILFVYQVSDFILRPTTIEQQNGWIDWHEENKRECENDGQNEAQVTGCRMKRRHTHRY